MLFLLLMLAQNIDLNRPADWILEATDGRIRCSAPDRKTLIAIEPVGNATDAQALLRKLAATQRLGPIDSPANLRLRGDATQAEAEFTGRTAAGPVQARATIAVRGGAATLYLAAAPQPVFAQRLPALVDMLKSFRFKPNQASSLSYQRQAEPREQSFSAEFPNGWRTELGLYRMGSFDNRVEASAVSPNATIFIGDRNLGNYIVPTPFMASLGFREGSMYNASGLSGHMLLRYLPGSQAGLYWLNNRLRGARVIAQRERPDLAQALAAQRYRLGNPMRATLHSGEVDFEYQGLRGQVQTTTEVYGSGEMMNWSVANLAGYFAKPEGEAEARAALAHALESWRVNTQWLAMDRKFQQIDAENAVRTMHEISAIQSRTYAERNQSNDRNARVRGDLLGGTYRVIDPTTGETATVQATSNYYYRVIDPKAPLTEVNLQRLLRLDWDTK